MIAEGSTGRKGKGGFYRLRRASGARVKEAIDLRTGDYRASVQGPPRERRRRQGRRPAGAARPSRPDRPLRLGGAGETLAYAAELVPAICDTVSGVDQAMRLGYNWRWGPFELIDRIGAGWLADRLDAEGRPVPALLRLAGAGPSTASRPAGWSSSDPTAATAGGAARRRPAAR